MTGAGGAIGREVTRVLAERGWTIAGLGHGAPPVGLPLATWINGEIDAANLSALTAGSKRPDAIIHLAGGSAVGPSFKAPAEDFARTAATSVRLLDWVRLESRETPVVLVSSAAVYGDSYDTAIEEIVPRRPLSPYGFHKAMMEMAAESWARNFNLRTVIVRLFSVYGPALHKQLVWELCTKLASRPRLIELGGTGAETRDWLHIQDAASILVDAIPLASPASLIFNGCTGVPTSIAETARLVADGFGVPARICFTGERRPGDPVHLVGSPQQAAEAGLRSNIPAQEGLQMVGAMVRRELGG